MISHNKGRNIAEKKRYIYNKHEMLKLYLKQCPIRVIITKSCEII